MICFSFFKLVKVWLGSWLIILLFISNCFSNVLFRSVNVDEGNWFLSCSFVILSEFSDEDLRFFNLICSFDVVKGFEFIVRDISFVNGRNVFLEMLVILFLDSFNFLMG